MATVVVTGTSRGIGLATALTLARAGHTIYATMRDPVRAPELGEIAGREGLPIHVSAMDVDSDASVSDGFAAIYAEAGNIDALVNNAGIARDGSIEELPLDAFRAVMETNYFGALRCIKAVVRQMRERGSGCIVNVTSIAGQISSSPLGAYAATKSALEAVSEALAQELKPFGVRVAIVQPGIIDTPMAQGFEPAVESVYGQPRRFAHMFQASLTRPTPPSVVAEKILGIVDGDSWKLRHRVGPDAEPTLAHRASISDEEHIDENAVDDDTWYARMEEIYGVPIRPKIST
jgi:NAD(P)-dependent dehydrogenase (short-subunit alcohol dehydrogenase family)